MRLALSFVTFLFLVAPATANAQQILNVESTEQANEGSLLPDKPEPVREIRPVHRFFDLQGKITNGANLSMATLDAVGTCRTLATPGGHEDWLPTQHCGPASLMILGGVALDISASYFFHRTGHHRLEWIMEIVGAADSVTGIAQTVTHGGKW